jgi:hypothetical protein
VEEQLAVRSVETSSYCDCVMGCTHEMGDRVKCASLTVGLRESADVRGWYACVVSPRSVGSVLLCIMHVVCEHDQALKLFPHATFCD